MTPERSTYQMSSDRINELLSKERQLFVVKDAWNEYRVSRNPDSSKLRYKLYDLLNMLAKEKEPPTEPMCVYCGWSGEGLAEHERDCKPMWTALDGEGY